MITASFSSVLSKVRSSLRRAHEVSKVCTQTNAIPRSAANWPSTRQRCPVGSHATVTPAKPALLACWPAQSNANPRSHARQRNVRRARIFESWSVTTTICLLSARSIPTIALHTGTNTRSRESRALRLRSPRETPLPLLIERPPLCVRDIKPDKRIRRTFLRRAPTRRTSFYAAGRACDRADERTSALHGYARDPEVPMSGSRPDFVQCCSHLHRHHWVQAAISYVHLLRQANGDVPGVQVSV